MAVMKKKGSKGLPPISTASLPDVIFMILFFFMVSTTMRDQELLVRYKLPEATEVQKLEKKSLVSFIHIGPPSMTMQAKFGTAPRIQLNDSYKSTRDTGYQSYIMVQNELTRAFNEVRDEVAQRKFGAKFADLPEELRNAVSKAVPLKISEAEPRNIKK